MSSFFANLGQISIENLLRDFPHFFATQFKGVPKGGLEPPRPCGQRILSPLRLPIPPLGQLKFSLLLNFGYWIEKIVTVKYEMALEVVIELAFHPLISFIFNNFLQKDHEILA